MSRKRATKSYPFEFFYQMINLVNGLLIVLAEMSIGREMLDLGSIEFVADAVIYLKHRVERGLLLRTFEIRKLRGAPINVVEVPFIIAEGIGIRPIFPPIPERIEIILSNKLKALKITEELLGPLYTGDIIFISYPSHAKEDPVSFVPLIDLSIENNLRTLFISYSYSVNELKHMFSGIMVSELGLPRESAERILKRFFFFSSISPELCVVSRLIAIVTEFAKDINLGIVVLHSLELLNPVAWDLSEYWVAFFNLFTWLKNHNVLVIRYSSKTDN
ncbi:MAG: ATPase domain-containing protein [Ignisphaera sp.]